MQILARSRPLIFHQNYDKGIFGNLLYHWLTNTGFITFSSRHQHDGLHAQMNRRKVVWTMCVTFRILGNMWRWFALTFSCTDSDCKLIGSSDAGIAWELAVISLQHLTMLFAGYKRAMAFVCLERKWHPSVQSVVCNTSPMVLTQKYTSSLCLYLPFKGHWQVYETAISTQYRPWHMFCFYVHQFDPLKGCLIW